MAFDGTVIAGLVKELQDKLTGGRINKISQPEKDELILTIKNYNQYKLYISASASLPLIYLTDNTKPSPMNAPNFCMLLRKHLNSARIISITQPGLERIIHIKLEHLDEMGDLCTKFLIIEIMGKHSNIIFAEEDLTIIDSIKRISGIVSSVREVLPGRTYFIPNTTDKLNPFLITYDEFKTVILTKAMSIQKAIYGVYTGISPLLASEICHRASIDPDMHTSSLTNDMSFHLFNCMLHMIEDIKAGNFLPQIIYNNNEPIEYSVIPLMLYSDYNIYDIKSYESVSAMLLEYYLVKNTLTRIRQKSQDLRRIVSTVIERNVKKYDLQLKQLKDTEKRDKYKVYGELLTTYGYQALLGDGSITVMNYYDNEELTIPLDKKYSAIENAKLYFERYNKLKRAYEALTVLSKETKDELLHLESIKMSLDIALHEEDLVELKNELIEYGYVKRSKDMASNKKAKKEKKVKITSMPFHYINSEGYHIYVGKNNFQNDELTFNTASGNDWWFHAKGIPGSHVLLKTKEGLPSDKTFEDAASLAAYYSKDRENGKVEVDYLERKNVKKPKGAKPGFVVYYTNYSIVAHTDISNLELIK